MKRKLPDSTTTTTTVAEILQGAQTDARLTLVCVVEVPCIARNDLS